MFHSAVDVQCLSDIMALELLTPFLLDPFLVLKVQSNLDGQNGKESTELLFIL